MHDKAYDLGYNGPPVPRGTNAYAFDNKVNGGRVETASIHYSEVTTVAERSREQQMKTHAPVVLDSPEQSPKEKAKLKTYEDATLNATFQQDYETRSANLKFGDENPEWESMDIQLRIDPTGERDPVITRRDTATKCKNLYS